MLGLDWICKVNSLETAFSSCGSGITLGKVETLGEDLEMIGCKEYGEMCRKWKEMRAYGVAETTQIPLPTHQKVPNLQNNSDSGAYIAYQPILFLSHSSSILILISYITPFSPYFRLNSCRYQYF